MKHATRETDQLGGRFHSVITVKLKCVGLLEFPVRQFFTSNHVTKPCWKDWLQYVTILFCVLPGLFRSYSLPPRAVVPTCDVAVGLVGLQAGDARGVHAQLQVVQFLP